MSQTTDQTTQNKPTPTHVKLPDPEIADKNSFNSVWQNYAKYQMHCFKNSFNSDSNPDSNVGSPVD